jgi:hypothetical protein
MDHLIFHFQLDGCSLHKESEDVVQQKEFEDNKKMEIDRLRKEAAQEAFEVTKSSSHKSYRLNSLLHISEYLEYMPSYLRLCLLSFLVFFDQAGEEDIEADAPKTGKNQFNYSERAAQTFNNTLRSRGVATEPPPVVRSARLP